MKSGERPARNQRATSYRLSPEALALIEALSKRLGVSRAAVVEVAVRHLARREKIGGKK